MRIIKSEIITETIKELCIKGACHLPADVYNRLLEAISTEDSPVSKHTLEILKENADIAANNQEPICQDTGMACIFYNLENKVLYTFNAITWFKHLHLAHIFTAKSFRCYRDLYLISRHNIIMNNRWCIIFCINTVKDRIIHHTLS